jgi:hypothetical protein
MICEACKAGAHTESAGRCPRCDGHGGPEWPWNKCPDCAGTGYLPGCKGGTWCDCQHRKAQNG